jgi:hypothetical protein
MKYVLTDHAIIQYAKRFAKESHQKVLDAITASKKSKTPPIIGEFREKIMGQISSSREDKSFKNNTKRLLHLYESYGYDNRYHFYKYKNKEFVGVERSNFILILTCYPLTAREKLSRSRYKRRDKHV